jgi:hypothetical protein
MTSSPVYKCTLAATRGRSLIATINYRPLCYLSSQRLAGCQVCTSRPWLLWDPAARGLTQKPTCQRYGNWASHEYKIRKWESPACLRYGNGLTQLNNKRSENTWNTAWIKVAHSRLSCPELLKSKNNIFIIYSLPFTTKNVKVKLYHIWRLE